MAFCKNCGAGIDDKAVICPKCGVSQNGVIPGDDTGSIGWGILGFFLPVVGLILYLIWKDSKPKSALMAGKGALASVIVGVSCSILLFAASACSIGLFTASLY